jgi:hypothetical protein
MAVHGIQILASIAEAAINCHPTTSMKVDVLTCRCQLPGRYVQVVSPSSIKASGYRYNVYRVTRWGIFVNITVIEKTETAQLV